MEIQVLDLISKLQFIKLNYMIIELRQSFLYKENQNVIDYWANINFISLFFIF